MNRNAHLSALLPRAWALATTPIARVRALALSAAVSIYVFAFATPALAVASNTSASGGIKKICPPNTEDSDVETFLGKAWGYADKFAVWIAILLVILFVAVAAIRPLRERVTQNAVPVLVGLVIAGLVITAIANNLGDC